MILYDNNGNLDGVQLTNADGSVTTIPVNGAAWANYVAQYGAPPPTGVPTNKPARVPLGYVATYQQIQALYGTSPALALKYLMAWAAVKAVSNPGIAADINAKLGLNIGFDQANP